MKLRDVDEVHAVDAGDHGRGQEHDGGNRENLDDGVLVNVDEAKGGVELERDGLGDMARMLAQGLGIAREGLETARHELGQLGFGADTAEKRHDALDRHKALGDLERQELIAAGPAQDLAIAVARNVGAAVVFRPHENLLGDIVDVALDMLEDIGRAIHDRLQQADEKIARAGAEFRVPLGLNREGEKRARIFVAHRNEQPVGEDEGDRCRLGVIAVGVIKHRRGHVARAILGEEAA